MRNSDVRDFNIRNLRSQLRLHARLVVHRESKPAQRYSPPDMNSPLGGPARSSSPRTVASPAQVCSAAAAVAQESLLLNRHFSIFTVSSLASLHACIDQDTQWICQGTIMAPMCHCTTRPAVGPVQKASKALGLTGEPSPGNTKTPSKTMRLSVPDGTAVVTPVRQTSSRAAKTPSADSTRVTRMSTRTPVKRVDF